jgi:hypothetical protein
MFKNLWLLIICLPLTLFATDFKPWYPRALEIQPQAIYLFQNYHRINSRQGDVAHGSNNHFLMLDVEVDYDVYNLEFETTFAATRHRDFGFCDFRLTGRYQLLDDVMGDPVSVVVGATYIQDNKTSLHDISCFYHGQVEGELHLAVGKEWTCEQFWVSRAWGVLGVGLADVGTAWLRGDLAWQRRWCEIHTLTLGMQSLWGLGGKNLNLDKPFHGYGLIAHHSIDLGIAYSRVFECGGIVTAGYAYRVYARNCPTRVSSAFVSYLYPFGL